MKRLRTFVLDVAAALIDPRNATADYMAKNPPPVPAPEPSQDQFTLRMTGKMYRVASCDFDPNPRQYEVQCGAARCPTTGIFVGAADARDAGWHQVKFYGWICPKCQEGDPLPDDQS